MGEAALSLLRWGDAAPRSCVQVLSPGGGRGPQAPSSPLTPWGPALSRPVLWVSGTQVRPGPHEHELLGPGHSSPSSQAPERLCSCVDACGRAGGRLLLAPGG